MNPSENRKPIKNGTFCRLKKWMDEVGVPHWDFHNVVPDKTGEVKLEDVDWGELVKQVGLSGARQRKVIICLGGFVARVMKQVEFTGIKLIFIDHPSPRNRNFNDPAYEPAMLKRLKKELKDVGLGKL
jgi:hypothetical protein